MKRKITLLTTDLIVKSVLVAMFFLFSIGEIRAQSSCATMPDPVSYTQVLPPTTKKVVEKAVVNGVEVTRELHAGNRSIDKIKYSNQDDGTPDETYCSKSRVDTYKGKNYPFMDSDKVRKIIYKFSRPVLDVEVFLAAFGYKNLSSKQDRVTFSVNGGGTISVDKRWECGGGNVAQLQSGNKIVSVGKATTDAKIGITSTQPFTELTLETDDMNSGYGFYVEICLGSILTPIDMSSCTPASVSADFPQTTVANVTLANGINVVRTVEAGTFFGRTSAPDNTYCGTAVTYSKDLPVLNPSKKTLKYKFSSPITSAEIFLLAFGDNSSSTTYDEVQFAVDKGTIQLSQTYNCNPSGTTITGGKVKSAVNVKRTVDVAIKVTSSEPFTEITLTDQNSTGFGYYVALCPTSVFAQSATDNCTPATIGANFPRQAVAITTINGLTITRTVDHINDISTAVNTSNHCGGNVNYPAGLPLLRKNKTLTYEFSKPIKSAEVFLYYFGDNLNEGTLDKLNFSVDNGTISLANVYDCRPGTTIINGTHVKSLTKRVTTDVGIKVTSTQPFTKITLTDDNSDGGGYYVAICPNSLQLIPTNNGASCTAFPVDPFGGDETSTPVATNGVNVTRKLTGSGKYQIKNNPNYCLKTHDYGELPLLRNDRVKQIDYSFDKPVTSAEIWLTGLGGGAVGEVDRVKFALDCGAVSLTMVSYCKETTSLNAAKDGVEDGDETYGNDVGLKITSKDGKPFSRISVIDNGSTAGGVLVSFCKTSPVVPTLSTSIDHPQNITVCVGKAAKFEAKATLTGANTTVTYQWQESQNGVTFGNLNGERGEVANGTKVYLTITPTTKSTYNNRQYRVVFKMLCGAIVQTSTAAKLTVNSALTINTQPVANTPNYCKGAAATALQVAATGDGTLSYQWYKNTVSSTTGGTAVGSNQNSYTPITTATGTTYYYVVVRNNCGVVTSSVAPINVVDADDYAGINISISPATYPDKEICTGATAPTIQAKASLVPGAAGGYVKYYQLQYAPAATGPWTDHPTQKYTNPGGAEKSFTLSNTTVATTLYYRVKYETNAAVCGTATGTKYSNVFKYTVKESAKVTAVKATPNSFKSGTTTNVVFSIEGTPNATVTCQIDSAAPQVITIPNTGTYIFPARSTSVTTVLKVTKSAKNGCETTYDLEARAVAVDASCSPVPAIQFPATTVAHATLNGVGVTRTVPTIAGPYSGYCNGTYSAGYPIILNNEMTYDFETPIKSVEVWLLILSNVPSGADKVQITTNNSCANVNYSIVYDCKAPAYPTTISSNGLLESVSGQIADVAVKVTSDKPFTQLKLTDLQGSLGAGELVELCPNSIEKAEVLSITTQPANQTVCSETTADITSQVALKNGLTGVIKYKWEQSGDNGVTWANATTYNGVASGTITNNGTSIYSLSNAMKSTPNKQYRVVYTYELCAGVVVTATSQPAVITVNDKIELNEFRAVPATIQQGVATTVTFFIKATPSTVVNYKINGVTQPAITIPSSGSNSFQKVLSETTEVTITKLTNNCTIEKAVQLRVTTNEDEDCDSVPVAMFPSVATNAVANFNGTIVTRNINGTYKQIYTSFSSSTMCKDFYTGGYPIVGAPYYGDATKVTYTFDKPVKRAQVWLLGYDVITSTNRDRVQFTTNCGNLQLQVSDCRNNMTVIGGVVTTTETHGNDIAVVITSDQPFTELVVDALDSNEGGYLVELCPSSIKPLTISVTTQPVSQSSCAGSVVTFTAKAVLENITGNVKYQWQETTNGSSWSNIAGATGILAANGITNYAHTAAANKGYRVVFSYDNTSCPAISLTATSSVATLTIDNVNLTSLSATPSQLEADTATTVVFSFRGTPNAEVTYQYNNELPDSIILDATGVATLTKANVTAPTTLAVTKIERGSCALTLTDPYMVELNVAGSACTTFPALQFPATAGVRTTTAQIAGMTVTRVIETGAVDYFNAFTYTSGTMCQRTIMAGYPILNKNTSKGERLSYRFEKPVTSVQVWLSGFGGTIDLADFAVDCTGTISVTAEGCQNTPLSVTGARVSSGAAYTQAKVTIRSNKPFRTLTITDPGSTGGGYVVELCPASIQEATVTITQEPRSIVACVGSNDAKFDLKAALPGATPNANVSYRLEQSDDGSTGWTIANATVQHPTGSSLNGGLYTFTLDAVTPAFNGKYYRVIAYYQSACAYVVATSTVVSVTVPTLAVEEVHAIPTTIEKGVATTVAFVVKATPRARVAYSYNGGAVQTVTMNAAGVYTHTVTVSDTATLTLVRAVLGNCSTITTLSATVQTFVVPTIRADHYTVPMTPTATTTRTIGRITNNDSIGTASVTLSTGGNATLTVTPVPANTPFIDPATGDVKVPPTTPVGVYTISYQLCTTATPVGCRNGQLTVTITQPTPQINPDGFVVTGTGTRTTLSVFNNDRVVNADGSTTTGTGSTLTITNVTVQPIVAGHPTLTINADGTITVPNNAVPGVYTITYDVCTTATPSTCVSSTVTLTVQQPAPQINSDGFVVTGTGTRTTPSVFNNDRVVNPDGSTTTGTGSTLTITNVTVQPIVAGHPTLTINADGTITVPNNAVPGVYTITYDVCTTATPSTCVSSTVTLTVQQPAPQINSDGFVVTGTGTRTTPSVFNNDRVVNPDGSTTTGTGSTLTITNVTVQPIVAGHPTLTINADGTITVPNNAVPGVYTITYDVCTTATPSTCVSSTVTLTVQQPAPQINSDGFVVTGTGTRTTPSVFNNDRVVNPDGSTTTGTGSTLTITNVTVQPIVAGHPTLTINADGTITVPNNAVPGVYTITYDVCTTATPSTCVSSTVTLTVQQPAPQINSDGFVVTGTGTRTTPSVFNNDRVVNPDGSTTTGTGSTLTITNVTVQPIVAGHPTLTINADGTITVPNNAVPGVYTITYDVCTTATPSTCVSATATLTVKQPAPIIRPESFTVTGTGTRTTPSILDNDDYVNPDGSTASATSSNVTITNVVVTPTRLGYPVPTVNPNGTITIPENAAPGLYTITYDVCTVATPTECTSGTVTFTVVPQQPTLVVNPDPLVVTGTGTRTTPSVLDNDHFVMPNGTTTSVTTSSVTINNVVVTPSAPGTLSPTLNPDGTITVPNGLRPGLYTITYDACVVSGTCVSATATLTVKQPAPIIRPESFTVTGTGTRTTPSILDNDDYVNPDGSTASATSSNVTITNVVVTPTRLGYPVPTVNPNGTITIPENAAPGLYTITYDVCTVATPTECTSGTVTFTVVPQQPTLVVNPDPLVVTGTGTRTTPSVLDNDHFVMPNGTTTSVTTSSVTINNVVVTPSAPGTLSPTLNPDGTITVPNGLRPGLYTITYDACVVSGTCVSATATLTVKQPAPIIRPDSFTVTGTGTRTTPSILDNDDVVNPDGSVASATGSNVTITNVVVTPTRPGYPVPTVNPNGTITIPENAAPGNYTITYDVCTVATPTECTSGVVTFTVVPQQPTLVVNPDPLVVTGTGTRTTPSILDNDDVVNPDGSTTSATSSNVTITNVVVTPTRPGYPVPTVNPNGTITIPENAAPGNYTITYDVCTVATPTECTSGVVTFTVVPLVTTLVITPDPLVVTGTGTRTTPSVLDNDHFVNPDGSTTSATTSSVTINNVVVTPSAPGTLSPTLNPDGTITVPNGLRPGLYTITYDACVVSGTCVSATATLTVKQPAPIIRPDSFTVTGTGTRTTPSILDNDDVVNPDGSVASATGSNVTITNVVVTPTRPGYPVPTVNPNGTITIPENAAPGNYTITYDVCTVATPTECTSGVVTFTVVSDTRALPIAENDRAQTFIGTPVTIEVLTNDTPNGAVTPVITITPAKGTAVVNADGTIEYTPNRNFVGTDSFVYELCNAAGCVTATVSVQVGSEIIIYNGVSLNGSDANNHFHIGGIENYPNNKVRIYNRWGVEVFSVEGYDNVTKVFTGRSSGRTTVEAGDRLPQGTYYYVIEYQDLFDKKQTASGWLYLKK